MTDHDQNFKNLILDYPRQALTFFAGLEFRYLSCYLNRLSANDYCESDNIFIRLNLPNMYYAPESRLAIYAAAQKGLATLESNSNLQSKYADFIDAYAELSEQELTEYRERYLNAEGGDMGLTKF